MPERNELEQMLSDFGLTPYQAKVYLTAVKLGFASASNISKMAGIRREEVYRAVPWLEKAGLVERVLGRPVKIKALPIEDTLSILIDRKRKQANKEISELAAKKAEIVERIGSEIFPVEVREEEEAQFILASERDSVAKRMDYLIDNAQDTVDIVDTIENAARFILSYEDSLRESITRGVRVRVLTEYPEKDDMIARVISTNMKGNNIELRYTDGSPGRYVLFDTQQVMLATSAGKGISNSKCLWTQDANLVSLIIRDFEDQFRRSIDWKKYKATPSDMLARTLKNLRPRDHVILIYDSLESKHDVLFRYISSGFERGEAAKYVCAEESPEEIAAAMEGFGINVRAKTREGALEILDYTQVYIVDDEFSIEGVLDTWGQYYEDSIKLGFT
ncbi:MAG: helix-turn-helix domain-containing protein, partial [Candidatus Hodarchaeota archaeon]